MLERFFTSPDELDRLRRGALSAVLDDVATLLYDEGYSPGVARSYLLIAGHFSRWLALEGIGPTGLHADLTARFRDEHLPLCRCPKPRGMRVHVGAALGHVMGAMKNRGWRAQLPVSPPCPVDQILRAFDTHLDHTCGAAPATRRLYAHYARGFLDSRFDTGEVDLCALKPRPLIDFISEQARERSPETAKPRSSGRRCAACFALPKSRVCARGPWPPPCLGWHAGSGRNCPVLSPISSSPSCSTLLIIRRSSAAATT